MTPRPTPITLLVADDDEDDREMIREAMLENRLHNDLRFIEDGREVMDYLRGCGRFTGAAAGPRPGLILLDLNMPRMDGREVLAAIKSDPELRSIPVVVLTTSKAEADIVRSYDLGANSFITKPVTFDGLVTVLREVGRYWLQIVDLPPVDRE
jgi:CheY-like chemotaxis protein